MNIRVTKPKATKPVVFTLDHLTKVQLADKWGDLKNRADQIKIEVEKLKEEFDRRKLTVCQGENFIVVKKTTPVKHLPVEVIKTKMGLKWYEANAVETKRTEYRVTKLGEAGE